MMETSRNGWSDLNGNKRPAFTMTEKFKLSKSGPSGRATSLKTGSPAMRMRVGHSRVMLLTGCPYWIPLVLIGAPLALNGSVPPYGKI